MVIINIDDVIIIVIIIIFAIVVVIPVEVDVSRGIVVGHTRDNLVRGILGLGAWQQQQQRRRQ